MEDPSNENVKSPESETPPHPKPISSTMTKRDRHSNPPPTTQYLECLKNHAASIGGLSIDGCGEFMPCPTSLSCAACGCHRNFHRREDPNLAHFIGLRRHHALPPPVSLTPSPSPSPPHMLLALSSHKPTNINPNPDNPTGGKRFRTRFTDTQKAKMQDFAEKLGWRMSRSEERAVEEFCAQVGVTRGVLKVWIHNNKQKRDRDRDRDRDQKKKKIDGNGNTNRSKSKNMDCENGNGNGIGNHNQNECNSIGHLHVSTNGSSSSS